MQTKRIAMLTAFISLSISTPTHAIDALTGTLAAAALALVGGASYLIYDHAHYSSRANCQESIKKFMITINEPTVFLHAARNHSVQPLIPVYEKMLARAYAHHSSLAITALTHAVVGQAREEILNNLNKEYDRLKNYTHYNDCKYMDNFASSENILTNVNNFYDNTCGQGIYHYRLLDTAQHELFTLLHTTLEHELHKKVTTDSSYLYPLHDRLEKLSYACGIYGKFMRDNNVSHSDSHYLVHKSSETIKTIKESPYFCIEEHKITIEHLRKLKNSLEDAVAEEKRKNNRLQDENYSLKNSNERLTRMVNELQRARDYSRCN